VVGVLTDDLGDALPKVLSDVFITRRRILNHVVEQCGYYDVHVGPIRRLHHEIEYFNEMIEIRLLRCAFAPLVAVRLRSEKQRLRQATKIDIQGGYLSSITLDGGSALWAITDSFSAHVQARRARPQCSRSHLPLLHLALSRSRSHGYQKKR